MPEAVEVPIDELLAGYDPGDPTNEASLQPDEANRGPVQASVPIPPQYLGPLFWRLVEQAAPSEQAPIPWGYGNAALLGLGVFAEMCRDRVHQWHESLEWQVSRQPQNATEEVAQVIGIFVDDAFYEGQQPMQLPRALPKFSKKRKRGGGSCVAVHGFTRAEARKK